MVRLLRKCASFFCDRHFRRSGTRFEFPSTTNASNRPRLGENKTFNVNVESKINFQETRRKFRAEVLALNIKKNGISRINLNRDDLTKLNDRELDPSFLP